LVIGGYMIKWNVLAVALLVVPMMAIAEDRPKLAVPVGLQLYSLRSQFQAEGVEKTLDRVKGWGFKYVELAGTYGKRPAEFKAALEARGLVAVSGHIGFDRWEKEPEAAAKEAADLGLKFVGCAWITHTAPFDEAACRHAAEVFNKAGRATAALGIRFFYHDHGYEFVKHGDGTLFDLLVKETDPKLVGFQMDVLWVVFPGQDPAKLLTAYPDRWVLMHLKDLRKGIKTGELTGKTDVRNDVVLGTGQVEWRSLVEAMGKTKVEYAFIEDESPTVLDQVPESLKFLAGFQK
jgi:sugar phosphate isomerase/epimerase